MKKENKRLENDCQLIKCQNSELIKNFMDIQRHVEESDHLNAKVCIFFFKEKIICLINCLFFFISFHLFNVCEQIAELESMENAQDRKNIEQLMNEMEKLKEQNKVSFLVVCCFCFTVVVFLPIFSVLLCSDYKIRMMNC